MSVEGNPIYCCTPKCSNIVHSIKRVRELYAEQQVNDLIKEGWILLSVGHEFYAEERGTIKSYILGNIEFETQDEIDARKLIFGEEL